MPDMKESLVVIYEKMVRGEPKRGREIHSDYESVFAMSDEMVKNIVEITPVFMDEFGKNKIANPDQPKILIGHVAVVPAGYIDSYSFKLPRPIERFSCNNAEGMVIVKSKNGVIEIIDPNTDGNVIVYSSITDFKKELLVEQSL